MNNDYYGCTYGMCVEITNKEFVNIEYRYKKMADIVVWTTVDGERAKKAIGVVHRTADKSQWRWTSDLGFKCESENKTFNSRVDAIKDLTIHHKRHTQSLEDVIQKEAIDNDGQRVYVDGDHEDHLCIIKYKDKLINPNNHAEIDVWLRNYRPKNGSFVDEYVGTVTQTNLNGAWVDDQDPYSRLFVRRADVLKQMIANYVATRHVKENVQKKANERTQLKFTLDIGGKKRVVRVEYALSMWPRNTTKRINIWLLTGRRVNGKFAITGDRFIGKVYRDEYLDLWRTSSSRSPSTVIHIPKEEAIKAQTEYYLDKAQEKEKIPKPQLKWERVQMTLQEPLCYVTIEYKRGDPEFGRDSTIDIRLIDKISTEATFVGSVIKNGNAWRCMTYESDGPYVYPLMFKTYTDAMRCVLNHYVRGKNHRKR